MNDQIDILPLAAQSRYHCAWKTAYFSITSAPWRRNPTGKNRVWDFFSLSNEIHPATRHQPAQPRRKIRHTPTKTASGIPYWPSRDPIEEDGVENLYGFVSNNGVNNWDYLGLLNVFGGDYDAGILEYPSLSNGAQSSGLEDAFPNPNKDVYEKTCNDQFGKSFHYVGGTDVWTSPVFPVSEWSLVAINPLRAMVIFDAFFSTPEQVMRGISDSVLAVAIYERQEIRGFRYACQCEQHSLWWWGDDPLIKYVSGLYKWTATKRKFGYSRVIKDSFAS